jgi:hypothetical protein
MYVHLKQSRYGQRWQVDDSPGQDKESNWVPAPKSGAMSLAMRLYAPRAAVTDGRWNPPPPKLWE